MTETTQHRTVLIVDDDVRSRRLIRSILAPGDHTFLEGADGTEAIDLYRQHHPDVVIMDIEMKPMDGITATRAIRAEDQNATIVVISKHEGLHLESAVDEAGARRFLPKIDLMSLPELLNELQRGQPRAPEPGTPNPVPGSENVT